MRTTLPHTMTFVAGVVLLAAGALKAVEIAGSTPAIFGLVVYEICLGLLLLSFKWRDRVYVLALLTFGIFVCVAFHEAMLGLPSCGCFGPLKVNPWYTFVFDVLMVLGLAGTIPQREREVAGCELRGAGWTRKLDPRRVGWMIAGLAGVALIGVGIQGGFARAAARRALGDDGTLVSSNNIVILEPGEWVSKRLPILKHIDIGDKIASGSWTTVLYHDDCPACQQALPIFERRAKAGEKIAAIEMPPYAPPSQALLDDTSAMLRGKLSAERDWFATTPLVLKLKDGIVLSAAQGEQVEKLAANQ